MNDLLSTFFATREHTNIRGELDGAAWRFVLPGEYETIEWRHDHADRPRDRAVLDRLTTVLDVDAGDAGAACAPHLVVGPERPPDALRDCPPVGIDLDAADSGRPLALHFEGHELRGVVPLDDPAARVLLERHVGADGPAPRTLKQRVRRESVRHRHTSVGALRGGSAGPPAWLVAAAAASGIEIAQHGWALWCRGDFGSQKLIMYLIPPDAGEADLVVKIVRDGRFNDRLVNETTALRALAALGPPVSDGAPSPAFETTIWGSVAAAQVAVPGRDLRSVLRDHPQLLDQVTTWLIDLAGATASRIEPGALVARLDELLARYVDAYTVPPDAADFLRQQIDVLAETPLGAVMQHGDAGPWNAVVTDDGRVVFLDWEAAEPRGLPLWDLFYFLRSASLVLSRRPAWRSRRAQLRKDLIDGSPTGDLVAARVGRYVDAVGIDRRAVEPLYHLCWVHRAVKQASRLPPGRRAAGSFHRFLLDGIGSRDRPGVRRIVLADVPTAEGGGRHG